MSDKVICHLCYERVERENAFPVIVKGLKKRICRACQAKEIAAEQARTDEKEREKIEAAKRREDVQVADVVARGCRECGGPVLPSDVPRGLRMPTQATCAVCVRVAREKWEQENRERRIKDIRAKISLWVGKRYAACSRASLDNPPPGIWAAADTVRSCFIFGPHGTGKTHAAAVFVFDALMTGRSVIFRTAVELVDELRNAIDDHRVSDSIGELRKVDLLIIDDLAMERPTEWVLEQLCRIVDWRYRDNAQTVFTSNLSPGTQLRDAYGPRLASRVLGLVEDRVFHMGGRDRREDAIRAKAP